MRRRLGAWAAVLTLSAAVLAALAPTAHAHPLGNFSVNHLSTVRISHDEVRVRYLLDQAEIPTVQERGLSRSELLARKRAELLKRLELSVDGRRSSLRFDGPGRVSFPPGSGGLETSRFEFELSAPAHSPSKVRLHDGTFPGRVGWKAVVAAPGDGTAVRTRVPSGDPTHGLTRYPSDLSSSPLDRRDAAFTVEPGDGTLIAPRAEDGDFATTTRDASDGFAGLFERAASGEGVLLVLLLAAFGWGALHALSPGHGKAMVAAYLVGTRGRPRHAVILGATVTVTHTIGVFALGVVTLALSQYVLPEDLYPWLNLVSGLLVVAIGAGVLRARLRHRRHEHHHHHHEVTNRGLIGMGAAAGMLPCPSALVVLLAAVAQHEIAVGLLLIVAFSLGLAGTLTVLGLAVVHARRVLPNVSGGAAAVLSAASALAIVGVGVLLTANAMPSLV
jgi:nickel/cobalt exporter